MIESMSFTTGGIIVLLISTIGSWLKIIRDTKKQNGNGAYLEDIKETVKDTDKKVDEMKVDIGSIKTDIKNQKKHCGQVTANFEKQIGENRDRIFEMKGERK